MKKYFYVLPVLVLLGLSLGFLKVSQVDPNADVSPANQEPSMLDTSGAGFPFPTLFNFNYVTSPVTGMPAGTVGALLVNNRYYFNRWNQTGMYRFNNGGPNGGPGAFVDSVTYTGAIRDLTTDGRYIYGGKASTILYRLDTGTSALLTQFTLPAPNIRAVAYDMNRKGFWHCDFAGNIVCHDTAGVTKGTITSTLAAKYGLAFDSTLSVDSAWVWAWDQTTTTTNTLAKYHAATGQLKASYVFTLTGVQIGLAGGAEVATLNNQLVMLLNYQNFALVGYRMKDLLVGLEQQNLGVREFSLNQNYPNPFNPSTKIEFTLTKAGDVSLEVYDVNGKLVETLINGYMNAGTKNLSFNASHLSSGTYFYKISTNGYSETKKMLLVK